MGVHTGRPWWFRSSSVSLSAVAQREQELLVPATSSLICPIEGTLWPVAALLCAGGPDVIRKDAWPFYGTIFGVRLSWMLEESKGPK